MSFIHQKNLKCHPNAFQNAHQTVSDQSHLAPERVTLCVLLLDAPPEIAKIRIDGDTMSWAAEKLAESNAEHSHMVRQLSSIDGHIHKR